MTPESLKQLRLSRDLTREELAKELQCSASAIVHWEGGQREIPSWVEEKMLRTLKITLPLDELHWILSESILSGQSAESILADAIRLWLRNRHISPSGDNIIDATSALTGIPVAQTAAENIAAETTQKPASTTTPQRTSYESGQKLLARRRREQQPETREPRTENPRPLSGGHGGAEHKQCAAEEV